jgi:hypothetical protein
MRPIRICSTVAVLAILLVAACATSDPEPAQTPAEAKSIERGKEELRRKQFQAERERQLQRGRVDNR